MKISAISDVHVKSPHDPADQLLQKFLTHPMVMNSEKILLLGDIFDLMCGPHPQYLKKFEHLFDQMDVLARSGKEVYFFEGNHDVHLEKLFKQRWPDNKVVLSQQPIIQVVDGKKYYFSHGDEHEVDNLSYQNYKKLILSEPLRFVANHVMPYKLLNFLGERASKISRKKGAREFDVEEVRRRFRNGVTITTQGKYNYVFGGHSHVQDVYEIESNSIYVNNGYAMGTKTFIHLNEDLLSFPSLV